MGRQLINTPGPGETPEREKPFMLNIIKIVFLAIVIITASSDTYAQGKKSGGMPPAIVVVAVTENGMIAPESEYLGTVYYKEVSEVAAEVSGKVEEVSFEDGQRITNKNTILVRLGSDLLLMSINSAKANYEQTMADVKKARLDLDRTARLFKEQLVSAQDYDKERFNVEALELKAVSLNAEAGRLEIELEKKTIKAPFEGIVLRRHVNTGEWLSPGSVVATIAKDTVVDIIAEVPESIINNINIDMEVTILSGGQTLKGKVLTIIPRGEISTRTFPVKIRVKNSIALKEGMEARVILPTGKKTKVIAVPRDAIITARGSTVVYTINESKAAMIPVRVIGYDGMIAGIEGDGLKEGMQVVIKGNERLRPGQDVIIQQ